jgi:hypothetical protein
MTFGWTLAIGAGVLLAILVGFAVVAWLADRKRVIEANKRVAETNKAVDGAKKAVDGAPARPLRARPLIFFSTVILGQDKRTSTSKTFVFLWTLLIGWALITLVIAGEVVNAHSHGKLADLQTGWTHFVSTGLVGSYLVLLGIPASAAVGAKLITQSQNANPQQASKTTATADSDTGFAARVSQIFSADDGTTDIGDLQYVIFNLVTAIYFVAHFIHDPSTGLPPIPDTLLGLTGVSGALYVAKKAATTQTPSITAVFPSVLRPNANFQITGTALTPMPGAIPGLPAPQVSVNGWPCPKVDVLGDDRISATVPTQVLPDASKAPISAKIVVQTSYSVTAAYDKVEIDKPARRGAAQNPTAAA